MVPGGETEAQSHGELEALCGSRAPSGPAFHILQDDCICVGRSGLTSAQQSCSLGSPLFPQCQGSINALASPSQLFPAGISEAAAHKCVCGYGVLACQEPSQAPLANLGRGGELVLISRKAGCRGLVLTPGWVLRLLSAGIRGLLVGVGCGVWRLHRGRSVSSHLLWTSEKVFIKARGVPLKKLEVGRGLSQEWSLLSPPSLGAHPTPNDSGHCLPPRIRCPHTLQFLQARRPQVLHRKHF